MEHATCILKLNPVNDYLLPHLHAAFAPLISAGVLAIARGGVQLCERLIHHPLIEGIHMTGSDKTYDAIMWGDAPAGKANRAAPAPLTRDNRGTFASAQAFADAAVRSCVQVGSTERMKMESSGS